MPEGLVLHPNQKNFVYPLGSTIVIGELTSSKNQEFLQGHSDRVSALTISHDGKYIASGQVTHMGFQVRSCIKWGSTDGRMVVAGGNRLVSVHSLCAFC